MISFPVNVLTIPLICSILYPKSLENYQVIDLTLLYEYEDLTLIKTKVLEEKNVTDANRRIILFILDFLIKNNEEIGCNLVDKIMITHCNLPLLIIENKANKKCGVFLHCYCHFIH